MKTRLTLALGSFVLAVTLSACGVSSPAAPSTTPTPTPDPNPGGSASSFFSIFGR